MSELTRIAGSNYSHWRARREVVRELPKLLSEEERNCRIFGNPKEKRSCPEQLTWSEGGAADSPETQLIM